MIDGSEAELASTLAAITAEMCLNLSLSLAAGRLLTPASQGAVAESLRQIARLYQELDNDQAAAGFWSAARLVEDAQEMPSVASGANCSLDDDPRAADGAAPGADEASS